METEILYFPQILITLLIAHAMASLLSSKACATSELSLSVPSTSMVKSLEPIETPSKPTLINSSIKITFTGSSTIIQNLNEDFSKSPEEETKFLTLFNSLGFLTYGIIICKFSYFSRTFLIAASSRLKTSGFETYLNAPLNPIKGLGSLGSQYCPPLRERYSFVLKSVAL